MQKASLKFRLAVTRKALNKARRQYRMGRSLLGTANTMKSKKYRSMSLSILNKARTALLNAMMETTLLLQECQSLRLNKAA